MDGVKAPIPERRSRWDYTVDVVYPSSYGVYQSPIHLAYLAATSGRCGPALNAPFTYVDLGCGAGLTICMLADCYPQARFHGVDINPQHIALGRDLARRSGLQNVEFHEASFADMAGLGLPPADFVGIGGIYSWLPASLRAACIQFVGESLADDGVLFLHYGALPGNAQIDALYAVLRQAAGDAEGDSLARFAHALRVVGAAAAAGARFFRLNPIAKAWITHVGREDPRGMAHEVLNAQRASLSVSEVAEELGTQGLCFVANAQCELNYLDLVAPDDLREDLGAATRLTREALLDLLRNTSSRMDVIMRRTAPSCGAGRFDALVFDRLNRGPLAKPRAELARRTGVPFDGPVYTSILAVVDGRPATGAQIGADPLCRPHGQAAVDAAIERLTAVKLLNVLRRPYLPCGASDAAPRLASRLNELVLEERIESRGALPFASPVAGTQLLLPLEDRLALLSMVGGDMQAAWRRISEAGGRVTRRGAPIKDAHALAEVAAERAERTGGDIRSVLTRLGVLV